MFKSLLPGIASIPEIIIKKSNEKIYFDYLEIYAKYENEHDNTHKKVMAKAKEKGVKYLNLILNNYSVSYMYI